MAQEDTNIFVSIVYSVNSFHSSNINQEPALWQA